MPRLKYAVQILLTLAILSLPISNFAKTALFLPLWVICFYPLQFAEIVYYVVVCEFFVFMNSQALKQGVFSFTNPDWLGQPLYEFFMWGFYTLLTARVAGFHTPPSDESRRRWIWAFVVPFAICFSAISDSNTLLLATAIVLAISFAIFHTADDFKHAGFMILLGTLVEYVGVHTGNWSYPHPPIGGVPLWYITLWGGVGFFARRLALPLMKPYLAR